MANTISIRTAALLTAAHLVGTQWILENPADRGDPDLSHLWLHEDHGPLWLMPEIRALRRACGASMATFPMCAFSAPWQKYTSLMYSAVSSKVGSLPSIGFGVHMPGTPRRLVALTTKESGPLVGRLPTRLI